MSPPVKYTAWKCTECDKDNWVDASYASDGGTCGECWSDPAEGVAYWFCKDCGFHRTFHAEEDWG